MDFQLVKYIRMKIKICYPCLRTNHNKQYLEKVSNNKVINLNQSDMKLYFQKTQIKKN